MSAIDLANQQKHNPQQPTRMKLVYVHLVASEGISDPPLSIVSSDCLSRLLYRIHSRPTPIFSEIQV